MGAFGEDDRAFDFVCAICDNGGEILSCRGRCLRSFHPTPDSTLGCESLNLTREQIKEIENFLCNNCLYKKHQCYACGRLGSSAKSDREVYVCGSSDCGLHYHPKCAAKLLHPKDEAKASQSIVDIKEGRYFSCPRHLCHICGGLENKKFRDLQFAICRRCPIAYHRRCLPREIIFEDNADEDNLQRAWDGLLPGRVLIYCMKHEIEKDLGTPLRNHLQFPPVVETTLTATQCLNRSRPKDVAKPKLLSPDKKKQRIPEANLLTGGPKVSVYGEKQKALGSASAAEARFLPRSSFPEISEKTKNEMRALLEKSSSSTTEKVRKKLNLPSTYCNSQRQINESISEEKVKETVKSARLAWAKLQAADGHINLDDGNIEEAKLICPPETLREINDWKKKLGVYLAPFIHGSRYTSFGRHFTKVDKLIEIVDKLHWYVQDGDMVVDFCCGSNEFSILMRDKLHSVGKKCMFKNFDLHEPKIDFNFEKRDWMTVEPGELPDGDQLIMGLNPPFGVKASLADKFINQALRFKPKILILIVPKETKRLDGTHGYDLVWYDPRLLSGKSFYLPGSIDDEHNRMEQWNVNPPPLYLWSRQEWAPLHREIAKKQGHLSEENNFSQEENIKTKAIIPNQLCYSVPEKDEENKGLLVEEGEITDSPPPNKEHDTNKELGFSSDMSISPDVKGPRAQDDGFDAGFGPGPSTTWFCNNIYKAGPSNPVDNWGMSGLGGWLNEDCFDDK